MGRISVHGHPAVIATRNHQFWVDGKQWSSAQGDNSARGLQLSVGDNCLNSNGSRVKILSIVGNGSEETEVYNLLLEGPGTWFANGLLTHSGMRTRRISN